MTQTAFRLKTRVLPGHRIEVVAPEIAEGVDIELIVLPPSTESSELQKTESADTLEALQNKVSFLDFVQTVAPGPRPFATWEAYEHALQEEKQAWER